MCTLIIVRGFDPVIQVLFEYFRVIPPVPVNELAFSASRRTIPQQRQTPLYVKRFFLICSHTIDRARSFEVSVARLRGLLGGEEQCSCSVVVEEVVVDLSCDVSFEAPNNVFLR